jgi:hypothetical protein
MIAALPLPSFRDTHSVNPEPRDSGFGALHRPGMTMPHQPKCQSLISTTRSMKARTFADNSREVG